MPRVPVLTSTRVTVVDAPGDAVAVRPPAPPAPIADVAAAVGEALRFPLAGPPLLEAVRGAGRVTVVVEPPSLPIPGSASDPRQAAIAAVVAELEAAGVPSARQTLLVAGGLARRLSGRALEALVPPTLARRFAGTVVVHDVEDPGVVPLDGVGNVPLSVNRALLETDAVVVLSAAETVLHGGPGALVGAGGREVLRAAGAYSLLETSASAGWRCGVALERQVAARVPLHAVSLALHHPVLAGALHGYPYEEDALERVAASPLRRVFGRMPGGIRTRVLRSIRCEIGVSAAYGGPPSVAHAEALLRAIEARAARLDGPFDVLVVGVPGTTPFLPRERPNPLVAAHLGLGLALRLWRERFPVRDGGTVVLLHSFRRAFAHPTQTPYRAFFAATRYAREPEELRDAEQAAADDPRAVDAYRAGRAVHPLLPFRDWEACRPALGRVGAVLVGGCRDAAAARQLGFVPVHGAGAALEMAIGRAETDTPRIGVLVAPPYFPLIVGAER